MRAVVSAANVDGAGRWFSLVRQAMAKVQPPASLVRFNRAAPDHRQADPKRRADGVSGPVLVLLDGHCQAVGCPSSGGWGEALGVEAPGQLTTPAGPRGRGSCGTHSRNADEDARAGR